MTFEGFWLRKQKIYLNFFNRQGRRGRKLPCLLPPSTYVVDTLLKYRYHN